MINKDTRVCISIAERAGNFGCSIHNAAFKKMDLNFIYKSFSVKKDGLESAIRGIRGLGIRGCGVTMPHKISVLEFVDKVSEEVEQIGSCNTIVNDDGVLTAYNTDAYSSYCVLKEAGRKGVLYILGNGGFSRAVKYSADKIFDNIVMINRDNWSDIKKINNGVIFNCTPVKNISASEGSIFIDCIIDTESGKRLSLLQASKQFELYTGEEFPMKYIDLNLEGILL